MVWSKGGLENAMFAFCLELDIEFSVSCFKFRVG